MFNFSLNLYQIIYQIGLKIWGVILLSLILLAPKAFGQERLIKTQDYIVKAEVIFDDLTQPWSIAKLPLEDEFLISQKTGELVRVNVKTQAKTNIKNVPKVLVSGQGGLLAIALHPDFASNNLIYLSYVSGQDGLLLVNFALAKLVENSLVDLKVFFKTTPAQRGRINFGTRIVLDDKNFVYASVGDRNYQKQAQDLTSPLGKIMRFNDDGSAALDNPFYNRKNAIKAIYSFGHRNPQGLFFDKNKGYVISSEHGPQGGDEVNIIKKGQNYGWPLASFGRQYGGALINKGATSFRGTVSPIWHWTPSMAPSNLVVYEGDVFAMWQGDVLVTSLKFFYVARLKISGEKISSEEKLFKDEFARPRDLIVDKGFIYLVNDTGLMVKLSRFTD